MSNIQIYAHCLCRYSSLEVTGNQNYYEIIILQLITLPAFGLLKVPDKVVLESFHLEDVRNFIRFNYFLDNLNLLHIWGSFSSIFFPNTCMCHVAVG